MGRHTKYDNKAQADADDYVNGGFDACGDVVPSRAGLAVELGVTRQTLTNWGVDNHQFLGTLQRLDAMQERISLSGGLRGELNSTIVKLLLANHGYSDRQQLDHTSSDSSMTPKVIERVIVDPSNQNA